MIGLQDASPGPRKNHLLGGGQRIRVCSDHYMSVWSRETGIRETGWDLGLWERSAMTSSDLSADGSTVTFVYVGLATFAKSSLMPLWPQQESWSASPSSSISQSWFGQSGHASSHNSQSLPRSPQATARASMILSTRPFPNPPGTRDLNLSSGMWLPSGSVVSAEEVYAVSREDS